MRLRHVRKPLLLSGPSTSYMSRGALWALGLGQLVNWGVLYYAFAVLAAAVQAELAIPQWAVTAAFSVGLLVSAALAPTVGRWIDRGHAPRVMLWGGLGAAALLALWAMVPGMLTLYAVWAGLGACMSAVLYEPAFAVVARAHRSPGPRLRALAIVTLCGGMASTVFLPVTAALVAGRGWRATAFALAGLEMVSTVVTAIAVKSSVGIDEAAAECRRPRHGAAGVAPLAIVFGVSSLATASVIATLVPTLGEQGLSPTTAASLGGLFGLAQLPGRALATNSRLAVSSNGLVVVSLSLQAVGLAVVAASPNVVGAGFGLMTFGSGAGLTTLARPLLVQSHFGREQSGVVNGRLARTQQLTRAAGPIAATAVAHGIGHSNVLLLLASMLGVLAIACVLGLPSTSLETRRWAPRARPRRASRHEPC